MSWILVIALVASAGINLWLGYVAERNQREINQLKAKLEDGEVMPGKATDPPAALGRLRQDR